MAYIVIGLLAGPSVLDLVSEQSPITLLAQVGVAVLLFAVGLNLDLQHVRHIGPAALATGLGQLAFTILVGFALLLVLDKGWVEALYLAVARCGVPAYAAAASARWVVTTFADPSSGRVLLQALQDAGHGGEVVASARDPLQREALARAGVSHILAPFEDAADHAAAELARKIREQSAKVLPD